VVEVLGSLTCAGRPAPIPGDPLPLYNTGARNRRAVSEVIGTLLLVGVVVVGIALVGVLLLSNPTPSKVPVFDSIISNRSKAIYIYHKGGDPLWAGQYKILVDGGDQTGNFTISGGTDPWSVGETLTAIAPSMPRRVVIILNQSGGGASILAVQDLYPSVSVPAPSDIMWYNYPSTGKCYWQYRKSITIDGSKVPATLSSFPVLVSLPSDAGLSASAQSDGDDILFTNSAGSTKLDHEIESYTSSTGNLVAWVEVPTVTSGTNTVIYMYYGNSTVASQQNPTGVWDANYLAVWHLNNVFTSSTGSNNGANTNTVDAAAKIGRGRSFDGTGTQYITITGQLGQPATVTLSAWASLVSRDKIGRAHV
jgi:flagellin-like protein